MLRCRSVAVNEGAILRRRSVSGWRRAPGRVEELFLETVFLARARFTLVAICPLRNGGTGSVAKRRASRQIPPSLQSPGDFDHGDQQCRRDVGRQTQRGEGQLQGAERRLQWLVQLRDALRGEE